MLDRNVACSNCLKIYNANEENQCPLCGAVGRCDVNAVPIQFDDVHTVQHYQIFPEHDIEARHIIARCIQLSGLQGDLAYHYGNALKYLLRLNRKGDDWKRDASKSQEYLGYMKE